MSDGNDGHDLACSLLVSDAASANEPGRDCAQPQKEKSCYRCGETGHISRECTNEATTNGGGGSFGSTGAECYKCGKVGHIARNCTQAGGGYNPFAGYNSFAGSGYGGGRGGQTCYTCGGFGHMSRDCTQEAKCYNCTCSVAPFARLIDRLGPKETVLLCSPC